MAIDVQQSTLLMLWKEDELVLDLDALQGLWTAEQYLKLTDQTNRLAASALLAGFAVWVDEVFDAS